MKKFLLALFVLLLVFAGGVGFYVNKAIKPENYQRQIESTVLELTGRSLIVKGGVNLRWRPMPTISLYDVELNNQQGSTSPRMLSAKEVLVEIEWGSLFKSPLKIKQIKFVNPSLLLEQLETGQTNWNFPYLNKPTKFRDTTQPIAGTDVTQTRVDNVIISAGTILYRNYVNNTAADFSNINGDFSLDSLKGPFSFNGNFSFKGLDFKLEADIEKITEDLPVKYKASLTNKASGLISSLSGDATPHLKSSIINMVGEFNIQKPNVLLEQFSLKQLPAAVNQTVFGNFTLESTLHKDTLKSLTVRIGSGDTATSFSGDLEINKKTAKEPLYFIGHLTVDHLDYKTWKEYFDLLDWKLISSGQSFPFVDLTLSLPTFTWNDLTFKNTSGVISYQDGFLQISEGKTTFPGNTQINFSGEGSPREIAPELTLTVKSDIKNVRELFNQFKWDFPAPQTASIATVLKFRPGEITVQLMNTQIDKTTVNGYVLYEGKNGELRTQLDINALNIDNYIPYKKAEKPVSLNALIPNIRQTLSGLKKLPNTIFFDIKGNEITWRDLPISLFTAKGKLDKGVLSLEQLNARNVASADLTATGTIGGIGTDIVTTKEFTVNFTAKQLPLFMKRANLRSEYPLINKASSANVLLTLSGDESRTMVTSKSKVGDTQLTLFGYLTQKDGESGFENLLFDLTAPQFKAFLKDVNINFNGFETLDGYFKTAGTVTGTTSDFTVKDASITIGTEELAGEFTFQNQSVKKLTGTFMSPSLNLDRFLPASSYLMNNRGEWNKTPFDFTALNKYDLDVKLRARNLSYQSVQLVNTEAAFTLKDKIFTLTQLDGIQKQSQTPVSVKGSLSWLNAPTFSINFDLGELALRPDFLPMTPVTIGDGLLGIAGQLNATGTSAFDMIQQLNGNGTINVKNIQAVGFDLPKVRRLIGQSLREKYTADVLSTQLKRALSAGKTVFTTGTGKWGAANGTITAPDFALTGEGFKSAPTQLSWNIPAQNLTIKLPVNFDSFPNLSGFTLTLNQLKGNTSYSQDIDAFTQQLGLNINQNISIDKARAQQAEEQAKQNAQQSRQEKLTRSLQEATDAVARAEKTVMQVPSDKTITLLQHAKDALTIAKELSVKENPTEAQYNQMLEQSRLAVLRAEEAVSETMKDDILKTRQNILALSQYAGAILKKVEDLYAARPYVDALLQARKVISTELSKIDAAANEITGSSTSDQINAAIQTANTAFTNIQKAYEDVARFDTGEEQNSPADTGRISGSFGRKSAVN